MTAPLYARSDDFISADMDGETVMMSLEQGSYFGIGGVGTAIWEMLTEPKTKAALVAEICEKYDVDEATCQADVAGFLADLMANGLISQSE